jgi:NUMOD3 motif
MTTLKSLAAWSQLSEQEQTVVESYINGDAFQTISARFNFSRQRAQQIYSRSLERLGVTDEQRAELSRAHRALINQAASEREFTPETRAKIGAAHRGRTHTEEAKAKIGAAHKGRKFSPEARARMSAAHRGRVTTDETRAKLRAAHLGKTRPPLSAEWRAHLSEAQKARRARIKDEEPTT